MEKKNTNAVYEIQFENGRLFHEGQPIEMVTNRAFRRPYSSPEFRCLKDAITMKLAEPWFLIPEKKREKKRLSNGWQYTANEGVINWLQWFGNQKDLQSWVSLHLSKEEKTSLRFLIRLLMKSGLFLSNTKQREIMWKNVTREIRAMQTPIPEHEGIEDL